MRLVAAYLNSLFEYFVWNSRREEIEGPWAELIRRRVHAARDPVSTQPNECRLSERLLNERIKRC